MLARHPFLEVFRSLRDAIVRSLAEPAVAAAVPPGSPLQDYYFDVDRLKALDAVLAARAENVMFDREEEATFVARGAARCELESADLAPHFDRIVGETYKEIIENGLTIVRDVRSAADRSWVGFQEPWIFEFFPMLSRAFPNARFLVLFRDPRGAVASMKGIRRTDPDQVVNTLSYSRHWRKYVALLHRFLADPELGSRMLVLRYERLILQPQEAAAEVCRFLEVAPDESMLDADRYVDFGKQTPWAGNSSYGIEAGKLDSTAVDRWQRTIDEGVRRLIEWTCAEDMRAVGYEPEDLQEHAALSTLFDESQAYSHWRSDFGDPVRDAGGELVRRALLGGHGASAEAARQCFLFSEMLDVLTSGRPIVR